jgi:fatty acyl-CoA reductase
VIREALSGKRIAITGATGFLGTALAERILRCIPDSELVLLVRAGRRGAEDRVRREILRNNCFDRLRSSLGADRFAQEVQKRVHPVATDVGTDGLGLNNTAQHLLARCDIVIHSAATVAFDSPLDAAVEINLLGPRRVATALDALGAKPHLIAISTAYVAGSRRGPAPEKTLDATPWSTDVPWRPEVDAARRARADADDESRSPRALARFTRQARAELGAAGAPLLAELAERLRRQWVHDRLVELGRARARGLGWPDAYAYSKALGERALLDSNISLPVTIVRPSIIESALAEPHPGWIRGFRMADPVIISYARGVLKEFPGVPEGIIDVIPVDFVVASILAVAARGPHQDGPEVVHVASGARNPLRYGHLVELVREWFLAHPLADEHDQPIVVPEFTFPGRRRVQRQLARAAGGLRQTERALQAMPLRGRQAELSARIEERRAEVERALSYVELYGAYTETEAVFGLDHLLDLYRQLPAADREEFCFDPEVLNWRHYCHDVYLPAVVAHARARQAPGAQRPREGPRSEDRAGMAILPRRQRTLEAVLSPERHMAVFDLENTLVASNVVDSWAWLATRHLDLPQRARLVARTLREAPRLLALDRSDRGDFLRHFYRRYDGAAADQLRSDSWELWSDLLFVKSFPAGIRRVRRHRELGHRTVLITGALDLVVEPLRPLFDDVICARLGQRGGRLTGELVDAPPTGEARALLMARYAEEHHLDLEESVAYADSASDLPMLEAVGYPVAVNPETKLAAIARRRGWHTENWPRAPHGPRPLLPIGPSTRATGGGA